MRASTVFSSVMLSAALSGCLGQEPPVVPQNNGYVDATPRTSTVSGFVHDPEAFWYLMANWPVDPDHPEMAPGPLLLEGSPILSYSSITGAHVNLVDHGVPAAPTSAVTTQRGGFNVYGVPTSESTEYLMRSEVPASGVRLGAEMHEPPPVPMPAAAKYYPTTTLRPIVASGPFCNLQVATMVSDAGALGALAFAISDEQGRTVTPDDLMDPSQFGGVVLTWVYAPSEFLDLIVVPGDHQIAVETNYGALYGIDWAPSMGIPGQTELGYMAARGAPSYVGYYAVVLPRDVPPEPLIVSFTDTGSTFPDGSPDPSRPWSIPPVIAEPQPGVSMARVHAFPGGEPPGGPPEDAYDEFPPEPDMSWVCMPMHPPGE